MPAAGTGAPAGGPGRSGRAGHAGRERGRRQRRRRGPRTTRRPPTRTNPGCTGQALIAGASARADAAVGAASATSDAHTPRIADALRASGPRRTDMGGAGRLAAGGAEAVADAPKMLGQSGIGWCCGILEQLCGVRQPGDRETEVDKKLLDERDKVE